MTARRQSRMKAACSKCGRTHPADAARAVGRFDPSRPPAYRADYPDSPIRDHRGAAEADWCARRDALGGAS